MSGHVPEWQARRDAWAEYRRLSAIATWAVAAANLARKRAEELGPRPMRDTVSIREFIEMEEGQ